MAKFVSAVGIGLMALLAIGRNAAAQEGPESEGFDDGLRLYAVHVNRTPVQPWPGYGMYLGNGLVITAAHVPGNFADTRPHVIIDGRDYPAGLVRQGSLEGVDLTLLSIDVAALPVRMRMRRLPLCAASPYPGERVVVITPESAAQSRVLPPAAVPTDLRARFDTVIGDVATTGNSGSGVLDVYNSCLLGVISRKITIERVGAGLGARRQSQDIAKYFVPVTSIRAFIPPQASF
ncbi:hypothetical protein DFR50_10324 [Roseiarcus fermentans]|uniref:Trypsin-like peptidase n=1 Tax=Roseiarcus fermentans TaxID=1473586 RepID=A0A366FTW5_9HYPH|nr:trypsin-like peptidase domain-containing protein [Roseiarcus fermentans]RBP17139.1 hypothetical protein DFR50_10324 [Roseiarcus fermentans]